MAAQGARHWEQDKEATIYVGNLDERLTDELIWELMLQVGRVQGVHLPKDRVTQTHQGFGFVEFTSEEEADYAARVMNGVKLHGKAIRVNKASADKQKTLEVGAELFVGNLDPLVDEQSLFETFSRFGTLIKFPSIARDENNLSKGFGFISYTDFDAADTAINAMNGAIMSNKEVTVAYALKKDGSGARHGDQAERELARAGKEKGITVNVEPINLGIVNAPMQGGPPMQQNGFYPPPQFPPQQMNGYAQRPMQAPPAGAGVPARPPPSTAGYGGPPPGYGGGYGGPPPGIPPGMPYGAPPPGVYGGPPPGMPANGFGAPPPGLPPQAYAARR